MAELIDCTPKEREWLHLCRVANPKAQERVFKHFYGLVFNLCLRYLPSKALAQEVLNDCFLKLFNRLEAAGPLPESFRPWLRQLTVYTAIAYYRKEKRFLWSESVETACSLAFQEEEITAELAAEEILALLTQLPDVWRLVFNLYEIEGYTHTEISELLSIPVSSSRVYLTRAKQRLKELMASKALNRPLIPIHVRYTDDRMSSTNWKRIRETLTDYVPPGQDEAWEAFRRFRLNQSPAGPSGKISLWKLNVLCLTAVSVLCQQATRFPSTDGDFARSLSEPQAVAQLPDPANPVTASTPEPIMKSGSNLLELLTVSHLGAKKPISANRGKLLSAPKANQTERVLKMTNDPPDTREKGGRPNGRVVASTGENRVSGQRSGLLSQSLTISTQQNRFDDDADQSFANPRQSRFSGRRRGDFQTRYPGGLAETISGFPSERAIGPLAFVRPKPFRVDPVAVARPRVQPVAKNIEPTRRPSVKPVFGAGLLAGGQFVSSGRNRALIGWTAGFWGDLRLNSQFSLETGLNLARPKLTFPGGEPMQIDSGSRIVGQNRSGWQITIPLSVRYQLLENQRLRWSVATGVATTGLFGQIQQIDYQIIRRVASADTSQQVVTSFSRETQTDPALRLRPFGWMQVSSGFELTAWRGRSLWIEPFFRYPLQKSTNDLLRTSQVGIQIRLRLIPENR
ncbi:RNA polymerase sigma factor [Larkinella sp. VNQ87]|uniref:RNA polymerase sigma factor n=1 Tax=Larkinella sp. VNQ87 TaxID=3400921 RepID=UPI003C0D21E7